MKKISKVLLGLGLATVATTSAMAGGTQTINATANIAKACTIAANQSSDLNFGAYDPYSDNTTSASASFTFTCTKGSGYQLVLDSGETGAKAVVNDMVHATDATQKLTYRSDISIAAGQTAETSGQSASGTLSGVVETNDDVTVVINSDLDLHLDRLTGNYSDSMDVVLTVQ